MSQMAVCESCGQRFDYGSGKIHTHGPATGGSGRVSKIKSVPERIKERVMIDMGQASMCWSDAYTRDSVYDSTKAIEIGDNLCQFIMDEIESRKLAVV